MTQTTKRGPRPPTGRQRAASDRLPTALHRRWRKPGEVNTRGTSIQNHRRECWLWPWRNGPVDPAANGNEMG